MSDLVTGALGFIGSHLSRSLDNPILCDSKKGRGIIPPDEIDIHFQDLNAVYHLGAISSTTEANTQKMTKNNILLSCKLLEECIDRDLPFVYASSASVYGLGEHGFSECAPMSPLNYYAISKACFDSFVLQKIKDNPNAKIYGLRYFNVYGLGEDHKNEQSSPVHKFISQSRTKGEIKVFKGSKEFLRDFIHVDDVVSATLSAKNFSSPGIYNVGTGVARSFLDVANIISDATSARITEIPFPEKLKSKYQKFTCSNNKKIVSAGYNSKRYSLEEGINRVLNA